MNLPRLLKERDFFFTISPQVDETLVSANTTLFGSSSSAADNSTSKLLEKLDIARVKKAGMFLDGCRIFLSGFGEQARNFI